MDKKYRDAVQLIKTAILQSQYEAARSTNEKQLMLYYGIGKYIYLLILAMDFGDRAQLRLSVVN